MGPLLLLEKPQQTHKRMDNSSTKQTLRNYGLQLEKPEETAYVLGGLGSLPAMVFQENGQWDDFIPVYEPQFNDKFDSYGCTVWGNLNALEFLIHRLQGAERNFSERFTYILAGVKPPGADPHKVLEVIRKKGVIDEKLLPMTDDWDEFNSPNPMTKDLLEKGLEFPYEVQHEYIKWGSKEERIKRMKDTLRYSPLGISVTAWIKKDGL